MGKIKFTKPQIQMLNRISGLGRSIVLDDTRQKRVALRLQEHGLVSIYFMASDASPNKSTAWSVGLTQKGLYVADEQGFTRPRYTFTTEELDHL